METSEQKNTAPTQTAAQAEYGLYLEVLFGPDKGRKIPLLHSPVVLGRTEECQIVMEDLLVSRRHLLLTWSAAQVTLQDLGSVNGTRIAGNKVSECALAPEQTFEIGSSVLVLRKGSVPAETRERSLAMNVATQPLNPVRISGTVPGMARVRSSEMRQVPSGWLARMVSWAVILLIAGGGMILALDLLESTPGSEPSMEQGGKTPATKSSDTERRNRRVRAQVVPQEPGAFLTEAPKTVDDRDVARDLYEKAMALGKAEKLEEAVAALEEVAARYPEFAPASGVPIGETVDQYKKTIHLSGIIKEARALLDKVDPDPAALQKMLAELEVIPATEGVFGGEAVLLADRVRSRIRQLSFGISPAVSLRPGEAVGRKGTEGEAPVPTTPEAGKPDAAAPQGNQVPAPAAVAPSAGPAPSTAPAPAAPASPAMPSAAPTPKPLDKSSWDQPVRKAYQKADFQTAVALAKEVAELGPVQYRQAAARVVEAIGVFSKAYREAMASAQKEGKEKDALDALEAVQQLDAGLYGAFQGALGRQKAEVHLRLAKKALKAGELDAVRNHMDLAKRLGPGLDAIRDMQVLLTTQATEWMAKGKKATSFAEASLAFRRAAMLAGEESATGKEATRLLKELTAATVNP